MIMEKKLKTLGPYRKTKPKRNYWMYLYAVSFAVFGTWFIVETVKMNWLSLFFLVVAAFMAAFTDREYQISQGVW